MEIKTENIVNAYNKADGYGKQIIKNLFPDVDFAPRDTRPVRERIKTFEDACDALGADHPFVLQYDYIANEMDSVSPDVEAYLKLRIVVAALNEGWEPQFTESEYCWYPWYYLYKSKEEYEAEDESWKEKHPLVLIGGDARDGANCGFVCANSDNAPSYTYAYIGSRLCLKSEALADYCGKQFANLWADFYLIRKEC